MIIKHFVQEYPSNHYNLYNLHQYLFFIFHSNNSFISGQVNPRLPRTFGDATIHVSHFDALVEGERELPEHKADVLTDVELSIGKQIADNLVDNGATLQMGRFVRNLLTEFFVVLRWP